MDKKAPVDKKTPIKLISGTKFLEFNFNSFVDLEEKYGSFAGVIDALGSNKLSDIRFILFVGLQEHNNFKTLKAVGKELSLKNLEKIADSLMIALKKVLPVEEETDESEVKVEEVGTKN